jgi:hypothetical protein
MRPNVTGNTKTPVPKSTPAIMRMETHDYLEGMEV